MLRKGSAQRIVTNRAGRANRDGPRSGSGTAAAGTPRLRSCSRLRAACGRSGAALRVALSASWYRRLLRSPWRGARGGPAGGSVGLARRPPGRGVRSASRAVLRPVGPCPVPLPPAVRGPVVGGPALGLVRLRGAAGGCPPVAASAFGPLPPLGVRPGRPSPPPFLVQR